jgi:hypothetical protein
MLRGNYKKGDKEGQFVKVVYKNDEMRNKKRRYAATEDTFLGNYFEKERKGNKLPRIQIKSFPVYEENEIIDVNDNYLYDCNLIIYLDLYDNIIHKEFVLLQKYPKNESNLDNRKIELNIENCEIIDGKLFKKTTKQEGLNEIFKYKEGLVGGVITVGSIIACIISSGLFGIGFIPSALLISKSYIDYKEDKKNEEKKINDVFVEQKINNLINQELKKLSEKK